MNVFFTFDLYLKEWDTDRGTLWACFQPHVDKTSGSDLHYYLTILGQGNASYVMATGSVCGPKAQPIPVNLRHDADLELQLLGPERTFAVSDIADDQKLLAALLPAGSDQPQAAPPPTWQARMPSGHQARLQNHDPAVWKKEAITVLEALAGRTDIIDLSQKPSGLPAEANDLLGWLAQGSITGRQQRRLNRLWLVASLSGALAPSFDEMKPIPYQLTRNGRHIFKDSDAYRNLNREPQRINPLGDPDNSKSPPPKNEYKDKSFAEAFNRGWKQAVENAPSGDLTDVANGLQLAFWGGARRYFPKAAFRDGASFPPEMNWALPTRTLLPDQSSDHTGNRTDIVVTNLHSLNGLLIRLAGKDEASNIADLKKVVDFSLVIRTQDGKQFQVSHNEDADHPPLKTYFASFPPSIDAPAHDAGHIKVSFRSDAIDRVLVQGHRIPMGLLAKPGQIEGLPGIVVQREPRSGDATRQGQQDDQAQQDNQARQDEKVRKVRKFGLTYYRKLPSDAQSPPPDDQPDFAAATLTVRPYQRFRVRFLPYRRAPLSRSGQSLLQLLQLVAVDGQPDFYSAFTKAFPTVQAAQSLVLLDDTGKRIPASYSCVGCFAFPWDGFFQKDGTPRPFLPTPSAPGAQPLLADKGAQEDGVILFYGPSAAAPMTAVGGAPNAGSSTAFTLLLPCLRQDGTPWSATLRTPPGKTGPLEWSASPWLGPDFDVLDLWFSTGKPTPDQMKKLQGWLCLENDYDFQPAQSALHFEGALDATFAAGAPANPNDCVRPIGKKAFDEYVEDLVNYNALDVREEWDPPSPSRPSPLRLLTPWGRFLPVSHTADSQGVVQNFQFRQVDDPLHPVEYVGHKPLVSGAIRFDDLYSRLNQPRKLHFGLEHTYGVELKFDDVVEASALCTAPAFPIVFPTSVRNKDTPGPKTDALEKNATADGSAQRGTPPFLSISEASLNATPATLKLTLQAEWLQDNPFDERTETESKLALEQANRRLRYLRAWQSVAEIAYAADVKLSITGWRFNFAQALEGATGTLGEGLENVPFKSDGVDIYWTKDPSQSIQDYFRALLKAGRKAAHVRANGQNDSAKLNHLLQHATLSVSLHPDSLLPNSQGQTVGQLAHLIQASLKISRGKTSGFTATPVFVREEPLPTTRDPTKPPPPPAFTLATTSQGEADAMGKAYTAWTTSLESGADDIEYWPAEQTPEQEKQSRSMRFVQTLGLPPKLRTRSPIYSEDVPLDPGSIVASVVPLTFRPVQDDNYLQDDTDILLRRYFESLSALFDCAIALDKQTPADAAGWRTALENLGNLATKPEMLSLLTATQGLINPTPVPTQTDPEVAALVAALAGGNPLAPRVQEWFKRQLWNDPGLFGTTKAFLYTRLRSDVKDQLLSRDYVRMSSSRGTLDRTGADRRIDKARWSYREGLVHRRQDVDSWYGVMEILTGDKYENQFCYNGFFLTPFGEVVRSVVDKFDPKTQLQQIPMKEPLHLPDHPRTDPDQTIALPSRAPLIVPTWVLISRIADCADANRLGRYVRDKSSFDLNDMMAGILNPLKADDLNDMMAGVLNPPKADYSARVTCEGSSNLFPRKAQQSPDHFVVSAMFLVHGDEESLTDAADAFQNDTFSIFVQESPTTDNDETPESPPIPSDHVVVQTFESLSKIKGPLDLSSQHPENLLNSSVVDFVNKALGNGPDHSQMTPPTDPSEILAGCFTIQKKGDGFSICEPLAGTTPTGPVLGTDDYPVEVLIFRPHWQLRPPPAPSSSPTSPASLASPTSPASTPTRLGTFVFLVNVEVPVWKRVAIHLKQTRNKYDPPIFASTFLDPPVFARSHPYQPNVFVDMRTWGQDQWKVELPPQDWTIDELAQRLLFDEQADFCKRSQTAQARAEKMRPGKGEPDKNQLQDLLAQRGLSSLKDHWNQHDLSVTVFAVQRTCIPTVFTPNGPPTLTEVFSSEFPVRTRTYRAFQDDGTIPDDPDRSKKVTWFPSESSEFLVDFQWSSRSTNLQFFRIGGISVKVARHRPGAGKSPTKRHGRHVLP